MQQHDRALESLQASMGAITEAWLGGKVSATYTQTALEQVIQLIEQERTSLAATSEMLADPRGAQLAASADQLERLAAEIAHDVSAADPGSARRHRASMAQIKHEAQ